MKNQIIYKKIEEIRPYENNPRLNDKAVEPVAESIREFGFRSPIVLDKDGIIINGHTRYKASILLGLDEVPCIIADDLTPEQVKAFRIADNRTAELASWDYSLLNIELESLEDFELDMSVFGFDFGTEIDWDSVEELSDETYEEPQKDYRRCPKCGHVDTSTHFIKVSKDEEEEE